MDYIEHLEVLGLEPGVSPHEIRRAYRHRAAVLTPDALPDDPRLQRQARARLQQLAASYRFLMKHHALEPVDLIDQDAPLPSQARAGQPVPARRERPSESPAQEKPSGRSHPRISIVRMVLVTAGVFVGAAYVVPAARSGDLRGALSGWIEGGRAFFEGMIGPRRSKDASVEDGASARVVSLPRLTKPQVIARYGIPEVQAPGKWTYSGFSVIFQDDSIASLIVPDSVSR